MSSIANQISFILLPSFNVKTDTVENTRWSCHKNPRIKFTRTLFKVWSRIFEPKSKRLPWRTVREKYGFEQTATTNRSSQKIIGERNTTATWSRVFVAFTRRLISRTLTVGDVCLDVRDLVEKTVGCDQGAEKVSNMTRRTWNSLNIYNIEMWNIGQ